MTERAGGKQALLGGARQIDDREHHLNRKISRHNVSRARIARYVPYSNERATTQLERAAENNC